jgi:putative endonuclease
MKKITFGLIAEYIALIVYMLKFYKILHHRKRYSVGEVDIIALRNNTVIFIEVKARRSNIDDRLISQNQQNRIQNAARFFLRSNVKYQNYDIRFDLVIVRPYKLPIIIENAW